MTYNQTPATDNHNSLYFIVGGLLVLALIIGAFVFNSNRAENNAYEPAAGYETTAPAGNAAPATNDRTGNSDTTAPSTDATGDNTAPLAP